jgi:PKD repeat protein
MKKAITILVLTLVYNVALFPQSTLLWAKQYGGTGWNGAGASSIAVDPSGNIYTTGVFEGTADFDPGPATFYLTSTGYTDIFISKLDASGNFVWAKRVGGIYDDAANFITLDALGNVYTTGYFFGTIDFDPGSSTYNLTAEGQDIYISKLDASGNFVWAKRMGGPYCLAEGWCIALDASGNVYTTGYFLEEADFDPGAGMYTLTTIPIDYFDIFVSKLDASGNFVWAKRLGGTGDDVAFFITVDALGNVYTTGAFQETADFDPGTGTYNLISAGDDDIFISKLDAFGNFVWAKRMGGTNDQVGVSIVVDASGNVCTTGALYGTADFDPGSGTYNLTSSGEDDIFISKLDAFGNFVWAKRMGGTVSYRVSHSIAMDTSGSVYITGTLSVYTILISKLDVSGNFIYEKLMGGLGTGGAGGGSSIAFDASGNLYVTGGFEGTVDFDPGAGIYNLTSVGVSDIFVLKLAGCDAPPSQPGNISGSTSSCQGSSQNYSVSNVLGVTYTWTLPEGWVQTGGGTTNAIIVIVGSGSGNITVTPSNACGIGTSQTLAVSPLTAPAAPATCSSSIGTPANGIEHHINLSCENVVAADGYDFNWSPDNSTWYDLAEGVSNSHDINNGDSPNTPFYYRARAFNCSPAQYSNWINCSPFPVYTACDEPSPPTIDSSTSTTLNVTLNTESPIANPVNTTYSIFCITTGTYVTASGALGSEEYQTKAAWGTISVTGLTCGTTYTFYAKAQNAQGDVRYNSSNTGSASTICAPITNFSASSTNPYVGETVTFTDLSTNSPISWLWSFSPETITYTGGTSSSSQNPQVQFDNPENYTVQLTAGNAGGSNTEIKTDYIIVQSLGFYLDLKTMLEGAFNGSNMNTYLTSLTDFPLLQPYSGTPWSYMGTENVESIPSNVVDWVLVELRDATDAANATTGTRIARQAGFVLNDGLIVSADGSSLMFFSASVINNLFAVVTKGIILGFCLQILLLYPEVFILMISQPILLRRLVEYQDAKS